jgi:hypothetical protein
VEDFRVETGWRSSRKRRHVEKLLGPAGALAVVDLWAYAADRRTSGDLSGMTDEAIAAEAGWAGDPKELISAFTRPGFEVLDGPPGQRKIRNWEQRQPWVCGREARREAARNAGRASAVARSITNAALKKTNGSQRPVDAPLTVVETRSTPPPSLPLPSSPTQAQEQAPAPQKPGLLEFLDKVKQEGEAIGRARMNSLQLDRLSALYPLINMDDVRSVLSKPRCSGKGWPYILAALENIAAEKQKPKSPGPPLLSAAQEAKRERDRRDNARQRAAMQPRTPEEAEAGKRALAQILQRVGEVFPDATATIGTERGGG